MKEGNLLLDHAQRFNTYASPFGPHVKIKQSKNLSLITCIIYYSRTAFITKIKKQQQQQLYNHALLTLHEQNNPQ